MHGPQVSVRAGSFFTCAILDNAETKCWGQRSQGKLGDGVKDGAVGNAAGQMGDNLPAIDFGAGMSAIQLMEGGTYDMHHMCAVVGGDGVPNVLKVLCLRAPSMDPSLAACAAGGVLRTYT